MHGNRFFVPLFTNYILTFEHVLRSASLALAEPRLAQSRHQVLAKISPTRQYLGERFGAKLESLVPSLGQAIAKTKRSLGVVYGILGRAKITKVSGISNTPAEHETICKMQYFDAQDRSLGRIHCSRYNF